MLDYREREGGKERERRERNVDLLFHLIMHTLISSCITLTRDQTHNSGASDSALTNRAVHPGLPRFILTAPRPPSSHPSHHNVDSMRIFRFSPALLVGPSNKSYLTGLSAYTLSPIQWIHIPEPASRKGVVFQSLSPIMSPLTQTVMTPQLIQSKSRSPYAV